ncbi:MAG: NADP-dependent malic enzyme [Cytophagales bacterium]
MAIKIRRKDALSYHEQGKPGKIEVIPTKPLSSQQDLALAYSPGVAEPCKDIAENPTDVYRYTAKGNLVGVISNGTAVLGLGNIGPEASKPVMEGKGVLFKKFAGIDVFDLEIDETDPKEFIKIVKSLEPTFGGINLEDIKSPEAFEIERELRDKMNIPVMHDDQHGTAIISCAALINALELNGKKIKDIKIIFNGAGAAALSCASLMIELGAKKKNLFMFDSKGLINKNRKDIDDLKRAFASTDKEIGLEDAFIDADVFVGLSVGNLVSPKMLKNMNKDPIVFALANPVPEIDYDLAMKTRKDIYMATGRSDHPNQVNNVLGFPFIFRGALDVRAKSINSEMKLAAVYAIANLAKEPVPEIVNKAYGNNTLSFGKDYLIPKPLDPRLITRISPAVAKAAMDSNVAQLLISDWKEYENDLLQRIGIDQRLISRIINRATKDPKKVAFVESDNLTILKAAQASLDEGIAFPILLGNEKKIKALIEENNLDLDACEIIDPFLTPDLCEKFGNLLYEKRQRRGVTKYMATKLMRDRNYFAAAMVETGMADVMISGLTRDYPKTIRPALEVIGADPEWQRVAGMYILINEKGVFFLADTTIHREPDVDDLVEIIGMTAKAVKNFNLEPKIGLLSYSNFGSAKGKVPERMMKAVKKAKEKFPDLLIEGEFQANVAISPDLQKEHFSFSTLAKEGANTLIFPDLASGNIAYKLLQELGGMDSIGPILMGMNKPVHILQQGSTIREILNMVAVGVVDAQSK